MAALGSSLVATTLVLLLALASLEPHTVAATPVVPPTPAMGPGATPAIDCGWACAGRCVKSKRPRLCKRACGTCCSRCSCVPPGTSGNYDACPCYAAMTTHDGARKCP